MLSKEEQFLQLIKNHKKKLLLSKNEINGDIFGSLLAWGFFISKVNGEAPVLFLPRYNELKKVYSFLNDYPYVIEKIDGVRDFILSFDTRENDIQNIRWEKKNDKLDISITPQNGTINPKDFSFIPAKFCYDLLLTLGTADFSELGKAYQENSDMFFELPIINIDTNQGNENYGQINIVNPLSSSLAELSVDLMLSINEAALKDEVAQCLLTALIEATDNLKSSKVTPHTFDIAALLMERGGNHQQILRALYDTETLESLKLWGKLLERLKEDKDLIWSFLPFEELNEFSLPDTMLRRFFVRLRNYTALDQKKLLILWQTKEKEVKGFLYKINKDNQKDQKIIEKTGGELFNNEFLYFCWKGEKEFTTEEVVETVRGMIM